MICIQNIHFDLNRVKQSKLNTFQSQCGWSIHPYAWQNNTLHTSNNKQINSLSVNTCSETNMVNHLTSTVWKQAVYGNCCQSNNLFLVSLPSDTSHPLHTYEYADHSINNPCSVNVKSSMSVFNNAYTNKKSTYLNTLITVISRITSNMVKQIMRY